MPKILVYIMDFFVIITVLLLVMVTLSLLSLWNYQYL